MGLSSGNETAETGVGCCQELLTSLLYGKSHCPIARCVYPSDIAEKTALNTPQNTQYLGGKIHKRNFLLFEVLLLRRDNKLHAPIARFLSV
jgi:hypothetical protein